MFGLMKRQTHEAELGRLRTACEAVNSSVQEQYRDVKHVLEGDKHVLEDQCLALNSNNLQLHQWLNDAVAAQEEACAAQEEAERKFGALQELHSSQVRVVTWLMDPVRMTARLRAIESSLRAERDGDKMVVYSDKQLTQPQLNAVNAVLLEPPNRT